jgi:hypothetical protein
MQKILKEYCNSFLDKTKLERKIYDASKLDWFNRLQLCEEIDIPNIIKHYKNEILANDKDNYYEIVYRNNCDDNYNLNWHLDDRILQKHQCGLSNGLNIIYVKNGYEFGLWNRRIDKKILKKTIIIYLSTIDIDFQGGELEFLDKIIRPRIGLVISFNNYDLHRVRKMNSGHRKAIVIKIYN